MSNIAPDAILKAVGKVRGGIKAPHNKLTAECETVRMPLPAFVTLPMSQHIGAPCTPTVQKGDHVDVGQVIGDTDAYMSVPVHASVSGTVTAIEDVRLANGRLCKAVKIESD